MHSGKVFLMARDKVQAVPVNSDSEHSLGQSEAMGVCKGWTQSLSNLDWPQTNYIV